MTPFRELSPEQLRRHYDPSQFGFASTAEVPELRGIIGQERATKAIEFGIEIPYQGYNIYAMGPSGAGKTSTITAFLRRKAATRDAPPDWGYVQNLADGDRPRAVRLPSGGGIKLRGEVDQLLAQLAEALPRAFASDQYAENRNALGRELEQRRTERLRELDRVVHSQGFDLTSSASGLMLVPLKNGKPLDEQQFNALSDAEQEAINQRGLGMQEALDKTVRQVHEFEEEAQGRLAHLDREIAAATIRGFFKKLEQDYADWPDVMAYLAAIQAHIGEHANDFKPQAGAPGSDGGAAQSGPDVSPYDRYRLNVIVDNQGLNGAPVVEETNPTYANLVGRVEMRAEFGALVTDYRYIKAGALHRANGGYLVLDARVLLRQSLAWDALKQALRNQRIRIEEMGLQPGVLVASTLTPEPIPLSVKVVLIGDAATYYLLYAYDEQFEKLFKVRADFAAEMSWTPDNEQRIAEFIHLRCCEEGLPDFDIDAVGKVVEYSGRLVEDQRKLTTRFAHVNDIIREAAFWAQRAGRPLVTAEDVTTAIGQRVYRSNLYEERVREMITDGTILVDTTGAVIGQVNALSVLELGDYAFGRPSRITARTFQGRSGVINIEREAKLSGNLHDKGVLILSGFLGGRYAQDKPLTLSASLAFEQSYEGVDGDSASSSELYALLSSLAGLPIRQDLAVTGSVNQLGEIQAIGGAMLKIEGFFDVCRSRPGGLTGDQGVIVPETNVLNLMLREDVVQAVSEGKFHIYPVRTVDDGIEILTGVPAGARGADGRYPADSANGRVDRRLQELAEEGKDKKNGQPDRHAEQSEPESPPHEPALPGDQPEAVDG